MMLFNENASSGLRAVLCHFPQRGKRRLHRGHKCLNQQKQDFSELLHVNYSMWTTAATQYGLHLYTTQLTWASSAVKRMLDCQESHTIIYGKLVLGMIAHSTLLSICACRVFKYSCQWGAGGAGTTFRPAVCLSSWEVHFWGIFPTAPANFSCLKTGCCEGITKFAHSRNNEWQKSAFSLNFYFILQIWIRILLIQVILLKPLKWCHKFNILTDWTARPLYGAKIQSFIQLRVTADRSPSLLN